MFTESHLSGIHADVSKPDGYEAFLFCMTSPLTSPDANVKDETLSSLLKISIPTAND